MPQRMIVVLGGAQAGPTAAARARETDEGARILLVERGRDVSYAVAGLASHLAGETTSLADLNRERADFFRDVYGIEVRTGAEATALDPRQRVVEIAGEPVEYSSLVFALGAESILPEALPEARNLFRFRTLLDLEGILEALSGGARRVAVVGGGFFGVEAAAAFLKRGCAVTVVERGPRLLPLHGDGAAGAATEALTRAGVRVLRDASVTGALMENGRVRRLRLRDGSHVDADLVVATAGLRPRTEILKRAGARLLKDGSVPIDRHGRTSLPHVYACGVCVSVPHAVTGEPLWLAQAALADKTAQVAGANAAGGRAVLGPALGTTILRAVDVTVARTGVTAARRFGFARSRLASVTVQAPSRDAWLRGADLVTAEVFYDRRHGRIVGGEVVAREGADKRIDVLATAVLGRLTVEQLGQLDLAYAPPYSAARDALNVAGTVAQASRLGLTAALTVAELAKKRGAAVVDVRGRDAHGAGTLAGAASLPLAELRRRLAQLPKKRLVFVDATGREAFLACRIARQLGRRDAAYLAGGLASWSAAGFPLEKGETR